MPVHYLVTSRQRAAGAMFSQDLKDDILVFVYPQALARTFHTFFCPPLRMIALDDSGQALYDEIIQPGKLVQLPACRLVVETAPNVDYRPFLDDILSHPRNLPQLGAVEAGVNLNSLLFALLAEAVADIRRVREAHGQEVCPERQRQKFEVWERGQMIASAGFLLDFSRAWNLPPGAVRLSRAVLQAEAPYLDELAAASVAGIPWRHEFPTSCMRCGKAGSWRSVLAPPVHAPPESTWRYQRPENAVPLCHHCVETLNFLRDEPLRMDMVWGLWGPRFEALWNWHKALEGKRLPEWDPYTHPLWPAEFGGSTWQTGSGALACAEPRPPHDVARSEQHLAALKRALYRKRFRGRQPGETPLQSLLDFRFEIPDGGGG